MCKILSNSLKYKRKLFKMLVSNDTEINGETFLEVIVDLKCQEISILLKNEDTGIHAPIYHVL